MNLAMVNLRVLASAGLALVTTIALFLTMKVLITGQNYEVEEELASFGIDFVRVEREEELGELPRWHGHADALDAASHYRHGEL